MKDKRIKSKHILPISVFIIFLSFSLAALAQVNITVDPNVILNNVEHKPIGINVNYLMDGSYLGPSISTKDALVGMGTRYLRFPGGEKSDNYFFDYGIYGQPLTPRFTRTGQNDWPSNDSRFALPGYTTPKMQCLDFDEFMNMCNLTGADPLVVVPYDCIYKAASSGGTIPSLEDVLRNAAEWVKYANITNAWDVKYWMIGNESYNTGSYNGYVSAEQYRDDLILFSQRMKAIDPTIKIVINGESESWWASVLPAVSPYIDFLGVSNYPVWNYTGGYEYYMNSSPDLLPSVKRAINSIQNYAQGADKNRIKVISTEFNSMDWSKAWPDKNDLGHALVVFDILGEQLSEPGVFLSFFWNTRWIDNGSKEDEIYDALSKTGELNANGAVLSIWGNFLLDKMVYSTSSSGIRTFASFSLSTGELCIFLLNKKTSAQTVNITLKSFTPSSTANKWVFTGAGNTDVNPVLVNSGDINTSGNQIVETIPPVSITIFKMTSSETLVKNQKEENEVLIYPNPVVNRVLNIVSPNSLLMLNSFSLFNTTGELFYTAGLQNSFSHSIILPAYIKPGMYFIKFGTEKVTFTRHIAIL